jgi:putative spermidine/putrescine transport system permease protein
MWIVTLIYLLYLATPIALLVLGSFGNTWSNTLLPVGLTGQWYAQLMNDPSFRSAFWVSLQVAAATVLLCALIGAPLAYAIFSQARRGVSLALRVIALLPVAAPAIVLGFGYLLVFADAPLPWLGSLPLLIAGHVVLCLPYMLQTLVADMGQLRLAELERAAASMSASQWRSFVDIVLPSLRHSLLAGSIMVAALSIGEFQLSNLIAGFQSRPYPVVLLQAFYGATGFACAATVLLLTLALIAALASAWLARSAGGPRPLAI